ncbi:5329_t:CDS:2, partial [Entrophospora sp. SA101]
MNAIGENVTQDFTVKDLYRNNNNNVNINWNGNNLPSTNNDTPNSLHMFIFAELTIYTPSSSPYKPDLIWPKNQFCINEGIIIINNGNDMIRVPITPISTYNDEFTSTKFTSRTRNNTTPSPCTTNGPEVTPTIFRAPTSLNSSGNYANYPLVLPPLSVVRCNITYTHLEDI